MQSSAQTPEEYLHSLPAERKEAVIRIRTELLNNLPEGFEEGINYGMLSYHVPHSLYPSGYHAAPEKPLPFINLANQKNFIVLYHMGLYSDPKLLQWFKEEFMKHSSKKLDMGKSCIRFKSMKDIPFELIGELASKITPKEWMDTYNKVIKR